MKVKINLKRAYDEPNNKDGFRILVDRLWPRGISKEKSKIDLWAKEVAPTPQLRRWFSHDPLLWMDFKIKYLTELKSNNAVQEFIELLREKKITTFVYAAKDTEHTHAIILKSYIEKLL
ncbi:MAG: DUF488 family protein [Bacteroidetes bacterium]|nr:DUF488 family protein [Bacteroidota bacterium]